VMEYWSNGFKIPNPSTPAFQHSTTPKGGITTFIKRR
jgi:hypothetical protein